MNFFFLKKKMIGFCAGVLYIIIIMGVITANVLSFIVISDVTSKSTWVPINCNFCGDASIEKSGIAYKGIMSCEYNYNNETKTVSLQYPGSAPAWAVGTNKNEVVAWINKNAYFQNTTCYAKEFGFDGTDAYEVTYDPTIWFVVFFITGGAGFGGARRQNADNNQ